MPGQNNYWDRDINKIDLPDPIHKVIKDKEHDTYI